MQRMKESFGESQSQSIIPLQHTETQVSKKSTTLEMKHRRSLKKALTVEQFDKSFQGSVGLISQNSLESIQEKDHYDSPRDFAQRAEA